MKWHWFVDPHLVNRRRTDFILCGWVCRRVPDWEGLTHRCLLRSSIRGSTLSLSSYPLLTCYWPCVQRFACSVLHARFRHGFVVSQATSGCAQCRLHRSQTYLCHLSPEKNQKPRQCERSTRCFVVMHCGDGDFGAVEEVGMASAHIWRFALVRSAAHPGCMQL